jgi:hypothetical protein
MLLIAGVALVAMTGAHALSLLGRTTSYSHVALGPAAVLAVFLLSAGGVCAIRRMSDSIDRSPRDPDWALPAFGLIRAIGPARTMGFVLAIQMLSLFAGEALEQRIAGVALGGVAGLFGSTLVWAPVIHFAVGIAAGAILWIASREICRHSAQVVQLFRAVLNWLSRSADVVALKPELPVTPVAPAHLKPIAFFVANRPPPISVAIA